MKPKVLYSLLALSSVFFCITYFGSMYNKPVFTYAKAKPVIAYQADEFDYSDVSSSMEKKQIFFNTLRPIIENQNQYIRDRREHILFAKQFATDYAWVKTIAEQYDIDWDIDNPDWEKLLFHIDIIPVELALTQAANESAWGQSRFAQEGNNLFGQWCFEAGCGLVPSQRDTGSSHEVKKFDTINDSVASYLHNINTTQAYESLREIRARLRDQGEPLDAIELALGLNKYSSRGITYVKEIQSMIKSNQPLMQGFNLNLEADIDVAD